MAIASWNHGNAIEEAVIGDPKDRQMGKWALAIESWNRTYTLLGAWGQLESGTDCAQPCLNKRTTRGCEQDNSRS